MNEAKARELFEDVRKLHSPDVRAPELRSIAGWAQSQRWFINQWASCGHRLTVRDGPNKDGNSWRVRYADYDREGGRSAIYASVCNKCYGRMRASGALLTHEQVEEWLTNGNLPALPNNQPSVLPKTATA